MSLLVFKISIHDGPSEFSFWRRSILQNGQNVHFICPPPSPLCKHVSVQSWQEAEMNLAACIHSASTSHFLYSCGVTGVDSYGLEWVALSPLACTQSVQTEHVPFNRVILAMRSQEWGCECWPVEDVWPEDLESLSSSEITVCAALEENPSNNNIRSDYKMPWTLHEEGCMPGTPLFAASNERGHAFSLNSCQRFHPAWKAKRPTYVLQTHHQRMLFPFAPPPLFPLIMQVK